MALLWFQLVKCISSNCSYLIFQESSHYKSMDDLPRFHVDVKKHVFWIDTWPIQARVKNNGHPTSPSGTCQVVQGGPSAERSPPAPVWPATGYSDQWSQTLPSGSVGPTGMHYSIYQSNGSTQRQPKSGQMGAASAAPHCSAGEVWIWHYCQSKPPPPALKGGDPLYGAFRYPQNLVICTSNYTSCLHNVLHLAISIKNWFVWEWCWEP